MSGRSLESPANQNFLDIHCKTMNTDNIITSGNINVAGTIEPDAIKMVNEVDKISIDPLLTEDSDSNLVSEKALKTYIDASVLSSDEFIRVAPNIYARIATDGLRIDNIATNTTSELDVQGDVKFSANSADSMSYLDSSKIKKDLTLSGNLSLASGTLDTVQPIQTTSSPTFANVTATTTIISNEVKALGSTSSLRLNSGTSNGHIYYGVTQTPNSHRFTINNHADIFKVNYNDVDVNYPLNVNNIIPITDDNTEIGSMTKRLKEAYFLDPDGTPFTIQGLASANRRIRDDTSVLKFTSSDSVVAGVWTYTITDSTGIGNMVFVVDEKVLVLGSASMSVDIQTLSGTNLNPNSIYIYVQNDGADNPELVASNTSPEGIIESVSIANFKGGTVSASSVTVYGEISQSLNPYEFIAKTYHRFFDEGTIYRSGLLITSVIPSDITIGIGSVKTVFDIVTTTQKQVTIDGLFYVKNDGTYNTLNTFNFLEYSDGSTVTNNRYFNVILGTINDGTTRIMALIQSKPATEYNSVAQCLADSFQTLVTQPNDDLLKRLFVPVARIVLQRTGTGVLQAIGSAFHIDIRGTVGTGGGSAGGASNVVDGNINNDFPIWNSTNGEYEPKTVSETKTILGVNTTDNLQVGLLGVGQVNDTTATAVIYSNANVPLDLIRESSTTNTVLRGLELFRRSSGTPASGIGVSLAFRPEDSGGNPESAVVLSGILNDVSPSAENATYKIELASDSSLFTGLEMVASTGDNCATALTGTFNLDGRATINPDSGDDAFLEIKKNDTGNSGIKFITGSFEDYRIGVASNENMLFYGNAIQDVIMYFDKGDGYSIKMPLTYNDTISNSVRDLQIELGGKIGYVSSILKSKKNINYSIDADFIFDLKSCSFNFRKRDDKGEYTEECEDELIQGFIYEDTIDKAKHICFQNEDGSPAGISYSKLIVPLVKVAQDQNIKIIKLERDVEEIIIDNQKLKELNKEIIKDYEIMIKQNVLLRGEITKRNVRYKLMENRLNKRMNNFKEFEDIKEQLKFLEKIKKCPKFKSIFCIK